MARFIERNLGRPLRILGMHSQIIHNNWKLYAENVRDSYHATLLHTFYTTFKVNRLDMDGGIMLSDTGGTRSASRGAPRCNSRTNIRRCIRRSYNSALAAPQLLETWEEFDDGITHSIQTIFPTLVRAVHVEFAGDPFLHAARHRQDRAVLDLSRLSGGQRGADAAAR